MGFVNTLDELTEKNIDATLNGDAYYRLQQNYKGLPFFGRSAVLSADDDGKVLSANVNVVD